jgi:chromosome segregation ATPase
MYSEQEMKEFFQNIVDQVATLSTQANKVEGLEMRIATMVDRLNQLEEDNRGLQRGLQEANAKVNEVQGMLSSTQVSLDNERAVSQSLRETIVQRDAGVQQLESSFRQEQDAHKITTSERDDARTKVNELQEEVERVHSNYNNLSTERDEWRTKAYEAERENSQLKQQLDKINSVLNPLRVVSQDVA